MNDVSLLAKHIHKSMGEVRIICLNDQVKEHQYLKGYNIEILPMHNNWSGWWAKYNLFSPDLQEYRPFLYIDLDTVILKDLGNIIDCVKKTGKFVTLRDFYQKKLASGMMWIPESSEKVDELWKNKGGKDFNKWGIPKLRMDYYIRRIIGSPDLYFQDIVNGIYSFKPHLNGRIHWLHKLPEDAKIICFHGYPDMRQVEDKVDWVKQYIYE